MAERKKNSTIPQVTEDGIVYTITQVGSSFIGTLEFKKPLQINGEFQGEIISNGILLISETANIKANIKVGTVFIGGQVIGNIEASNRVEMLSTAKLTGNIKTPKLKIADGVVFDGNCEMISPSS